MLRQHAAYGALLRGAGAEVHALAVNKDMPDGVFVEDTAIVFDEVAVMASLGASSRRSESVGIEPELRKHRNLERIALPALLDGGDVVVTGRSVLVGLSSRTDAAGAAVLRDIVARFGYDVRTVRVAGCLHLKSACTPLPDGRLLVNPEWIDVKELGAHQWLPIDASEPFGADVALVGENVIAATAFPRTNERIAGCGFTVREADLSEFAKAEGGVTCLSLIFRGAAC
jgi:dimethylargininase